MYEKLGEFKYDVVDSDGISRILKDTQTIEGGGKYYGFWYAILANDSLGTPTLTSATARVSSSGPTGPATTDIGRQTTPRERED